MNENGQKQEIPVDLNKVVGKLTEQIARLSFELVMTQVALEEALEQLGAKDNGATGRPVKEVTGV